MFPKTDGNEQFAHSHRNVTMASYTLKQDATILGAVSPGRRIQLTAENLDRIFPGVGSLDLLEVGASQVFPADELAGGSAFPGMWPSRPRLKEKRNEKASSCIFVEQTSHSPVRILFVLSHSFRSHDIP